MNRIYRLVWCRARGALVVASELARSPHAGAGRGRGGRVPLLLTALALGVAGALHATAAQAQSVSDAKLADLQVLVNKYDPPAATDTSSSVAPVAVGVAVNASPSIAAGSLPVPALHASARVSTPVAGVRATARLGHHGAAVRVGLDTHALAGVLPNVTRTAAGLPVVGKSLSPVTGLAGALASSVPTVQASLGVKVGAPSSIEPQAADRRRVETTSQARSLGIAEGGDGLAGTVNTVVGEVTGATSKLPVAGPVVSQVGQALGSVTSGGGNPTGVVGGVVGAVTNATSNLPVAGPVVAQVGQALGSVTSGGGNPTGVVGGVVGAVTNATSKLPVAGPVVAQIGQALGSVTSGGGNPTGVVGGVVSAVTDATSNLPVAGPVVSQVDQALGSVTSGGGNPTGVVGGVVGAVTNATSNLPVAGPVVSQVGQALGSVTSGGGNPTGVVGGVIGAVTNATSNLPVAGPVVSQVGQALGTVTSGGGSPTGVVSGVVGAVTDATSKLPVVGPVVGQVGGILGSGTGTPGNGDLGTTLGKVVGGVVNHGAELPVVGSTVASVGQALKTATSGGGVGEGLQGQVGMLVGGAVNSLSSLSGVGPVVSKVGQTVQETTAQIGNGTGTGQAGGGALGQLLGGVLGSASSLPVVGSTVSKVGDVLTSATSGNGNATGVVGQVVGGVTGAASKLPVVGPVVGQVGDALAAATDGSGDATGVVDQVVDGVVDSTSQLPVVGSVTQQLGQALTSATGSGDLLGSATGLLPLASGGSTSTAMSAAPEMATEAAAAPAAVPVVPAPSATPTGLIVGNGGLVGTATQLLGSSTNALFTNSNSNGYITNGSLQVSNANFTQGYSVVSVLGLPVVNTTPVGTVLQTVDGTTMGGTGSDSHLTLIGGVTSGNYITDINNGAAGGLLGLVLPSSAPAWASTCLNVLGVAKASCWAVNAAQDYQVLVGDGASANGSEEVVIGTNASHTLPAVSADTAFPGNGTNDPNDPTGVPTDDYAARLGHSVVIGDEASGTANAQTILGAGASSSVANSVALGYQSIASRGAQAGYSAYGLSTPQNSAGEVSIGSPGQERQITNVAAGSADTDAVNVAQLMGVAATADNAVEYDDASKATVSLAGPASTDGGATNGTTITNLHQGALDATSTDAVNGSQLFATNSSLAKYMGGTTNFDPTTNTWTAPTFTITSVATDGSTTKGNYDNVTDAFAAVDGSVNNLNSRINNIDTGGSKYFQANSTGTAASAQGTDSVAVGPASVASGDSSMAMGNGATASADNAVAIGTGAVAQNGSAVSIGNGNTADGDGAVAMGDPNTATGQGAVALGYNNQATGQGAIAMGSTSIANGASALALGDTASATADNALAIGAGAQASMANSIALGAGSVTSVGALSNYTAYALTTPQNSTGEVNVGGRQITGVAAGAAADDAVNVAQLQAVANSIQGTDKLAVKYDADTSGNPTDTVSLVGSGSGPVTITNLAAGAVTATSSDAINGSQLWGWTQDTTNQYSNYSLYNDIQNIKPGGGGGSVKYFNVNSTLADSSATGSNSIAIGPQATSSGSNSVAMGNGASATADNSVAIGAGSVADRANTVSVGSAGSERQITNVAAGTETTDAVNVGQLDSVVQASTAGTVRYDTNTDGSIDYGNITLGNGSGSTVIHNVGAGTAPTDAVNVGQLQSGMQQAVNWANAYTNQQVQQLSDRANAGVAAAMAMAGMPQAYEPGKSMAAVSAGTFRGESSIAIGVSTISEGGRWVYKLSGSTDSRGDAGVAIGAGMQW